MAEVKPIKLTPPQSVIYNCDKRFRVVVCGRRFGKTFVGLAELIRAATVKEYQTVWYVAPTYKQAKNIMWKELKKVIPLEHIRKKDETDLYIELINGSVIALKGADNADSLRGASISFVVMDEFADSPQDAYEEVIRPAMSDQEAPCLFIGTPKGHNWAYKYYLKGLNPEESDWESYTFTTIEGGNVSAKELEAARKDLTDRAFKQEYEASFETLEGRVYYSFNRAVNVKSVVDDRQGPILVGMDFNVNPMAAVVAQAHGDECHIIDEILIPDSNTIEMCDEIKERYPDRQITVYPDPAGASRKTSAKAGETDFSIIESYGFKIVAPRKHPNVADRVQNTNRLFCNAEQQSKMFIHYKCEETIAGFDGLTYKKGTKTPDKSLGIEHPLDAAGYLTMEVFPPKKKAMGVRKLKF